MDRDLVSVVIPSFNHRPYIGAAIESVFAQGYSPVELIVVDDGSVDGSAAWVAEKYGSRVGTIISRPNRGAHAAINEGIEKARGKFVAILNSDDVYAPGRLSRLVDAANAENLDIAFSDVWFLDEKGVDLKTDKVARAHAKAMNEIASLGIEEALLRRNFVLTTSNFFIRREAFARVGGFRGFKLCHDWDFLLRAIGHCKFGRVAEPLLGYRWHGRNTITRADKAQLAAERALVYLSYLLGRGGSGEALSEDFIFQAEPFEPLAVAWLLAEARRIGIDALIAQAEKSELHPRMTEAFERNGLPFAGDLSVRRLKKKMRGRWKSWFGREP
jgi:glycosyltransferase involved in cell wall biosynthesis